MKRFLLFLLCLSCLSAEWPCFDLSIGSGVQYDRSHCTPYGRTEAGIGWEGFFAQYQADVGNLLWNQRATLSYDFSFLCFHLLPTTGWNQFESHSVTFSGPFVGADTGLSLGPLSFSAGYRYTFDGHADGQIGIASIGCSILPLLSLYLEGEGRFFNGISFASFHHHWNSYDLTVGARFSF